MRLLLVISVTWLTFEVSGRASTGAYYALAKALTAQHYQDLIDRGWRRSGDLLYKPNLKAQCCPHYTIRLEASAFKPAKDQRQAVNRWSRYILGDDYMREAAIRYPKTKQEKSRQKTEFDLCSSVHQCEFSNVKVPPQPDHKFEITLEPDDFSDEKFGIYRDYQSNVHHDAPSEITRTQFRQFLCASPLKRTSRVISGQEQKLGSFHQCYRLDGRLVAFAVLDLLPHAVSAVYFVYHNDMVSWQCGKLSAMREAALARESEYKYYYMGYYIHNCVKMRYKGDYKPQHVLDPESYCWDPLDGELKELLDKRKYVSLSHERRHNQESSKEAMDTAEIESPESDEDSWTLAPSLFDVGMPGIMTVEEVEDDIDLGETKIQTEKGVYYAKQLKRWERSSATDPDSTKGAIAELLAAIGPGLGKDLMIFIS